MQSTKIESTAGDFHSSWVKVKLSAALRGSVDDPGDDALEIVGERCRVSHDACLPGTLPGVNPSTVEIGRVVLHFF